MRFIAIHDHSWWNSSKLPLSGLELPKGSDADIGLWSQTWANPLRISSKHFSSTRPVSTRTVVSLRVLTALLMRITLWSRTDRLLMRGYLSGAFSKKSMETIFSKKNKQTNKKTYKQLAVLPELQPRPLSIWVLLHVLLRHCRLAEALLWYLRSSRVYHGVINFSVRLLSILVRSALINGRTGSCVRYNVATIRKKSGFAEKRWYLERSSEQS